MILITNDMSESEVSKAVYRELGLLSMADQLAAVLVTEGRDDHSMVMQSPNGLAKTCFLIVTSKTAIENNWHLAMDISPRGIVYIHMGASYDVKALELTTMASIGGC